MQHKGSFSVSSAYRRYVLGLLVVVGVCGWVDRNVFAMLLESIRGDFNLSDTQLGLLGGVAFGVFYASVGLPVAWLADRYNRRSLIAVALALWSVMTALCGLAAGFLTLFLARVGVGIGEAGGSPPSQALIADYFPPARRASALGVFYLYIPLGFVVGYLGGGWLDTYFDWRAAFVAVGLPGVLLAVLVRLTLREPVRGFSEGHDGSGPTPSLTSTLRYLCRTPSLRWLSLAGALHGVGAFAAAVWLPAYLMRSHALPSSEAGAWLALAYGVGGGGGVLLGGFVADRLVARSGDTRWYAWGSAAAVCISAPLAAAVYMADARWLVCLSLCAATFVGHTFLGPVTSLMQGLAGLRRRAVVAACYLFLVNLVSMGLGPLVVGMLSDALAANFGDAALGAALLCVGPASAACSAACFLRAAQSLREDLDVADAAALQPEHAC